MKTRKTLSALLLLLAVLPVIAPFAVYGAPTAVSLSNMSGTVYPGCQLTVSILATGENIESIQGNPIDYDQKQLTMVGEPTTRISGWNITNGSANFLAMPASLSAKGISGRNLELIRFTFQLNDSVKIGDTVSLKVNGVKIVASESYSGNLTYTVTVTEKPKNTNCNLMTFSCKEGAFTPAFNAESSNSDYAITVPNSVTALQLTAIPANNLATCDIEGNENFQVGLNTIKVTVTAESGATRVYTLRVTRKEPPSTNALLSELNVGDRTLTPAFSPEIFNYTLTVPSDVTSIEISPKTAQSAATFTVDGNEDLKVGENTVTVTVLAEDRSSSETYTVVVTRERPVDTVADLSELSFGDYGFSPAFDKTAETQEYSVTVPYEVEGTDLLRAVAESSYATVKIDAQTPFTIGENAVTVTVTAEDQTTVRIYRLTVTREARILSSVATLKSLVCDIGVLAPAFSPENTVYTLLADPDARLATFSAITSDDAATVLATSAPLQVGMNEIKIPCTAENGTVLAYTVYVFVPEKNETRQLLINGTPTVGQKLTLNFTGDSSGGTFSWYVGDVKVEGVSSDTYTLLASDVNKTVKAVFTDADGNEWTSQVLTVLAKQPGSAPNHSFDRTALIVTICTALIALCVGVTVGIFFTKRRYIAY